MSKVEKTVCDICTQIHDETHLHQVLVSNRGFTGNHICRTCLPLFQASLDAVELDHELICKPADGIKPGQVLVQGWVIKG